MDNKYTKTNNKNSAGFTLIEMIVVFGIFSIILGAIFGIFISSIRAQRYSLSSQQLINQTSYAMEYMSRFLRMAKKDDINCTGIIGLNYGGDGIKTEIKFKNYHGDCQRFYVSSNQLYQQIGSESLALTSAKFNINSLKFNVNGDSQNNQPKVTIYLEMEGKGIAPQPKIKIQTTVSQRDINEQ